MNSQASVTFNLALSLSVATLTSAYLQPLDRSLSVVGLSIGLLAARTDVKFVGFLLGGNVRIPSEANTAHLVLQLIILTTNSAAA